ncbi:hypothetical protein [Sphaerisporangium sp. TRM90804]|uniref:hypothetical protein n=1 Tax=Sphaerisporangium sp. TRM90804 TaxID=3031113 RepID=UPI00244B19CA|nr:hypothetical protein [Sphaerisporangium sp. TRM90804]MDH2429275.1 hypothetical protein [Sphaerisporangium sp. TRM90804]
MQIDGKAWICIDRDVWSFSGGGKPGGDGRTDPLGIRASKAYLHAVHRLSSDTGLYNRIDGILALKRAMRARLEHLAEELNLRAMPVDDAGNWLNTLEQLGIIRQRMLRKLNKLRNSVEHDDAEPPDWEQCSDLEEVLWYFLKVTESYLRPPVDLELEGPPLANSTDNDSHLGYKVSYTPFAIEAFSVRINGDLTSASPVKGWIEVRLQNIEEREGIYKFQGDVVDVPSQLAVMKMLFEKFS